jgi:hypothetical protein
VARLAIAAGEEFTCDYNINIANGTAWPCRCGAARCRGQVARDFFLRRNLAAGVPSVAGGVVRAPPS